MSKPEVSQLSFRSEAKFEPLFWSLRPDLRFLLHPLSSRELSLCYLGLTLLRRLVFRTWLGAVFPAVGIVFTRSDEIQA
jgi:hypothetical protein